MKKRRGGTWLTLSTRRKGTTAQGEAIQHHHPPSLPKIKPRPLSTVHLTNCTLSWSMNIWSKGAEITPPLSAHNISFLGVLGYKSLRPWNMYNESKIFLSGPSFKDDWTDILYETWENIFGMVWFLFYTYMKSTFGVLRIILIYSQ